MKTKFFYIIILLIIILTSCNSQKNNIYDKIISMKTEMFSIENSNWITKDSLQNIYVLEHINILKDIYPNRVVILNLYEDVLTEKMNNNTFWIQSFQNTNSEFRRKIFNPDSSIDDLYHLLIKMKN